MDEDPAETAEAPVAHPRIVVGVDGSPPSDRALRWAADLAVRTGDEIEALIAWPPFFERGLAWVPGGPDWNPAVDAAEILELSLDRVFGEAIPRSLHRRVVEGGAAKALVDASRDAAMLVVGSRGHGGFTGLLLGSVSAACAQHATCPVVVMHGDRSPGTPESAAGEAQEQRVAASG